MNIAQQIINGLVLGSGYALIAIGCVLRGATSHYDYVCSETARGLQLAQMDSGLPIMFCVLTCDTLEQAIDRAIALAPDAVIHAGDLFDSHHPSAAALSVALDGCLTSRFSSATPRRSSACP